MEPKKKIIFLRIKRCIYAWNMLKVVWREFKQELKIKAAKKGILNFILISYNQAPSFIDIRLKKYAFVRYISIFIIKSIFELVNSLFFYFG